MKKVVVGVSRVLSPRAVGHAYEEQPYFNYDGMGRQTNAVICAAYSHTEHVPPAASSDEQAS